jgi:crossover junction endodeoxyribonuclease RuvC
MSFRPAWIGIDPGLSGALALYVPPPTPVKSGYVAPAEAYVEDMPSCPAVVNGDKRTVDHWQLHYILVSWRSQYDVRGVTIERVSAMPDQGVTSSFNFGDSFGAVKQAVASVGLHFTLISPATWKAIYGLRGGREHKAASVTKAIELFPDLKAHLYGPRGGAKDGRAEAALLAHYGSRLKNA